MYPPGSSRRLASSVLPTWLANPFTVAMLLLGLVMVGGTAGYFFIEGWALWDAFYMTVITVTTVGYREVHPLSRSGQAFTMALLIGGVGTVLYTTSLFAARLVEGGLKHTLENRKRLRMLDDLNNHFVVCGYGRIGSTVVAEFQQQGVPFVVIERDPERVHTVIQKGGLAVEGDASSEYVLNRVGIQRARGFIAAVSTDAENVFAILSARLANPALYIIGRAESEESARKLKRAGADRVLSPYQIGAQHMAQLALRPAVVDFVQLATSSGSLELSMEQILVRSGSALVGQTLTTANLRQRFGVIVVAIRKADGKMEFNPSPDAGLGAGDQLVVLGKPGTFPELEAHAQDTVRGS